MAAACSARLRRERATTSARITRRDKPATAMMAMKAQSGSPPSEEGDADSEEPAAPGPAAPGFAEEEPAPWEAPAAGSPGPEPEPEPEAAGAAMARASDADAASPTAKRRVVEAATASPAVVVPRKVTVAV